MVAEHPSFFKWVVSGKLLGSPFPLGQDLNELLELKVKLVVTLTSRGMPNRIKERLQLSGVEWKRLPVPDFGVPNKTIISDYLQSVCKVLMQNKAVLTHCIAGCGRTGTMIGLFLTTHGHSPEDALEVIHKTLGGGCPETKSQIDLIYQYTKKCPNFSECKGELNL
ncbi:MAG: dual specificity protein phosphatase family protein [Candidatus Heimdallarchaeota archaeon]|nr:MAG: dual specificity protein phosphatase family protein [Candidatus Heimdallarchaeota archaeon]